MSAKRLDRLERRLDRVAHDVEVLKADVATLKADVEILKADVEQLKADVAQLKADVAQLKTDVAQLKTDVTQLKAEVGDLRRHMLVLHEEVIDRIRAMNEDRDDRLRREMQTGFNELRQLLQHHIIVGDAADRHFAATLQDHEGRLRTLEGR